MSCNNAVQLVDTFISDSRNFCTDNNAEVSNVSNISSLSSNRTIIRTPKKRMKPIDLVPPSSNLNLSSNISNSNIIISSKSNVNNKVNSNSFSTNNPPRTTTEMVNFNKEPFDYSYPMNISNMNANQLREEKDMISERNKTPTTTQNINYLNYDIGNTNFIKNNNNIEKTAECDANTKIKDFSIDFILNT